jgi:hypothetical protein
MIAGNNKGFTSFKMFFSFYYKPAASERQPYFHPKSCNSDKNILSFRFRNQPAKHRGDKNYNERGNEADQCP